MSYFSVNDYGSGEYYKFIFREAQGLAKMWSCPFFEASAKLSRNVDELFTAAVSEMNKFGKKPRPVKKPCCFM